MTKPSTPIPLESIPTQRAVQDARTGEPVAVQATPLRSQSQSDKPNLSANSPAVTSVTISADSSSGLQSQAQTHADQAAATVPKSRLWTIVTLAGLAFGAIATVWAIGTGAPQFRLAQWTAHNDYLQSCIALAGLGEAQTDQCNDTIRSGPKPPPFRKRDILPVSIGIEAVNTLLIVPVLFGGLCVFVLGLGMALQCVPMPSITVGVLVSILERLLRVALRIVEVFHRAALRAALIPVMTLALLYCYFAGSCTPPPPGTGLTRLRTRKRWATPALIDMVFGQLFAEYTYILALVENGTHMRSPSSRTQIILEYWFPLGAFWSPIVHVALASQPGSGPSIHLRILRRVPDTAPCVHFALNGDIEGLRSLFTQGLASPMDVTGGSAHSLLGLALHGRQSATCRFLVKAGADPNFQSIAAYYASTPADKANQYLLQRSLTDNAEVLLRDILCATPLIEEQRFTLLPKAVIGLFSTSVEKAIEPHPDCIDALVALLQTPLHWAAARGDTETAALLLAHGADPNILNAQGVAPLHLAAEQGRGSCCRLLLEAGALPDPITSNGIKPDSPLHRAARISCGSSCMRSLLEFGANVGSRGMDGQTALMHAARVDNVSGASLLLDNGADLWTVSTAGQTPLTIAITSNSHEVLQLILDRSEEAEDCTDRPPFWRSHLLESIALYADATTIKILLKTDHLARVCDPRHIDPRLTDIVGKRHDFSEGLSAAFDKLLSMVKAGPWSDEDRYSEFAFTYRL